MTPPELHKLALSEIDAVYRLASHLAPRRDYVDDLVQETYLRAFKYGLNVVPGERGLRPYLFKILHNVLHTRLSRENQHPMAVEDFSTHAAPDTTGEQPHVDLSTLDWETVDERLKRAIEGLPLAHRSVFLLCAVERLRYHEIADVVQIPVGTVMSRLHRARELLAQQLSDLAEERGIVRTKIGQQLHGNREKEG